VTRAPAEIEPDRAEPRPDYARLAMRTADEEALRAMATAGRAAKRAIAAASVP
jgi:hypothetical protein